jgi:hypothetical protein
MKEGGMDDRKNTNGAKRIAKGEDNGDDGGRTNNAERSWGMAADKLPAGETDKSVIPKKRRCRTCTR